MVDKEKVRTSFEEVKVKGNQLVDKVKEIIEEGNARKVSIRKDGRTLIEVPLSVGVGGAAAAVLFAAPLAAISAIAALVTDVDIVVEREEEGVTEVEVEEVSTEEE